MSEFIKIVSISLAILLVSCVNSINYEPSMYQVKFGLLNKIDVDKYIVTETNSMSFVEGDSRQVFGYHVTPNHSHQYVYNVVVVPPEESQANENKEAIAIDTGTSKVKGPSVFNMWITDGKEKGNYKFKLFINGSLADSREFLIN